MTGERIDAALPRLRCPVCRQPLGRDGRRVACPTGHSFDLARQGYLNLAVGQRSSTADSPAMVAARAGFLGRGHYDAIAEAVSDAVATGTPDAGFVVDLAGGTGWYLARVLDATGAHGTCVDLSAPALRRAANAHPRAAAVGADAWRPLPLRDGAADAVLSVFGPRDPAEIERVLAPDGLLVAVSPEPEHLAELVAPLGMIGMDPDKRARTAAAFERFTLVGEQAVRHRLRLTRGDAYAAAAMGPSARHVPDGELRSRVDDLPDELDVTASVTVRVYRRARPSPV